MASGEYKYRVEKPAQVLKQTTPDEVKLKKRGKLKYCKRSPDEQCLYKHNPKRDTSWSARWTNLICKYCGRTQLLFDPNTEKGFFSKDKWNRSDLKIIDQCEEELKQKLYEQGKQQEIQSVNGSSGVDAS